MPENPIALSPHVQRLINEKYAVSIEGQYIVVDNVPYVSAAGVISRAAIISAYHEKDGVEEFGNHAVWFTGSVPCTAKGDSLAHIMVANTSHITVAGRQVLCMLSYKSERTDMMENIYNKLTHYIRKLQSYVKVLDPTVSANTEGSISVRQERSVFFYPNTAIARAGLDAYEDKLKLPKVTIVGLGGTGSYILDALAKTPVKEIHLYDDDFIEPATVYRMPGALTIDEAYKETFKTDYLRDVYCRMRTGIQSHPVRIDHSNLTKLDDSNFVFIAVDDGPSRGLIASHLVDRDIPFIDVGMGVDKIPDDVKLFARVRVTAIDSGTKTLVKSLPVSDDQEDAVYNNIQVAELNALNAMLAVVTYKQKIGFYSEENAVNIMRYVLSWQRFIHTSPDQT